MTDEEKKAAAEKARLEAEAEAKKLTAEAKKTDGSEDVQKQLAEIQEKLKQGEIKGMSESTAHALLETMNEIREQLRKKEDKRTRWIPF